MSDNKRLMDYTELMRDWDQELNADIDPGELSYGSHRRVNWRCHKCGRTWNASVKSRVAGSGCTCDAKERRIKNLRRYYVERDGSLAATRPEIAAQWHPTMNGDLTPEDITEHSMFHAWWIGDDGVPWQSVVSVRCRREGGTKRPKALVIKGLNDLKTLRPDLAAEWNYEKNAKIDIDAVMPGSKRKAWWICDKGHEWQATITSRNNGRGCPVCNQERNTSFPEQATYYYVSQVFPDAQNRYYPEDKFEVDVYIPSAKIAIEYDGGYYHASDRKKALDLRKNLRLKELGITLIRIVEDGCQAPENTDYVIQCNRKNRKALIDDALKELFQILERITGLPVIMDIDSERDRTQIYEQYILSEKQNSLSVIAPDVLSEWHPTKNGKLKPDFVHAMSNKKFWWKCDKCGYEWKTPAYRRAKGMGCPVCAGNVVAEGINDFKTVRPDLMEEWNYDKNTKTDPSKISAGSNKKVWWKCRTCSYEWEAVISNRTRGNGCPRCAKKIVTEENSFASLYPELALQWDHDRNGKLKPQEFLSGSEQKAWWICEKGHTWRTSIISRTRNNNCPYCGNKKLLTGFNDFATVHPGLLSEWDYSMNDISPEHILCGSNKKVFWICKKGHSWQATISNRIRGRGCPYCDGKKVSRGETDLETLNPALALEWDYEKNGNLKPSDITPGSNKRVWWKCPKCSGEWEAIVWSRAKGRGCPYCAGVKPIVGVNDLQTVRPDLISEWNYERNTDINPQDFLPGSRAKIWWKCRKCGNEWQASIGTRSVGRGCPVCAGKKEK